MEPLPRIPSPPSHLWKEFRVRVLPVLFFAAVLTVVVIIWKQTVAAPTASGEVERIKADVISPRAGRLIVLTADLFQEVKQGQKLGTVRTISDDLLRADLAAAEANLNVMRARMTQNEDQNIINYQGLRLNWMSEKVNLASAQANLVRAEADFRRAEQLFNERIESEAEFDRARAARDSLKAEVEERSRLTSEMAARLTELRPSESLAANSPLLESVTRAIDAQEEKLRQAESLVALEAPMDGVITVVLRRPGENVSAGETIVSLVRTNSDRIIGFLRQPIPLEPRVGMKVEILTKGPHRQKAVSRITQVGFEMQLVTSALRVRGMETAQERGLPFLVDLPPSLRVHPGEMVDLVLSP